MKIYLALTDGKWFGFHRDRNHREVNFWKAPNVNLEEGCDLVVFKRHNIISRHDNEIPADGKIVGGGFLKKKYKGLSVEETWNAFKDLNGTATKEEFESLTSRKKEISTMDSFLLESVFYFPEENCFSLDELGCPISWRPSIVTGKYAKIPKERHALVKAINQRMSIVASQCNNCILKLSLFE